MTYTSRIPPENRLAELPDYILGLIWFNATVSADRIVIKHGDPYIGEIVADFLPGHTWQRGKTYICQIHNAKLVSDLHELGYSGKRNFERTAPPIEAFPLAKAYIESHASLTRSLRRNTRESRELKQGGIYIPCVKLCSAPGIVQAVTNALAHLDIAPERKAHPGANGKSLTVAYTAPSQLRAMYNTLSADCEGLSNTAFWERFDEHISKLPEIAD